MSVFRKVQSAQCPCIIAMHWKMCKTIRFSTSHWLQDCCVLTRSLQGFPRPTLYKYRNSQSECGIWQKGRSYSSITIDYGYQQMQCTRLNLGRPQGEICLEIIPMTTARHNYESAPGRPRNSIFWGFFSNQQPTPHFRYVVLTLHCQLVKWFWYLRFFWAVACSLIG